MYYASELSIFSGNGTDVVGAKGRTDKGGGRNNHGDCYMATD